LAARGVRAAACDAGRRLCQQPSRDGSTRHAAAYVKGLGETGYVEGQNVMVEYHWLDGRYDRISARSEGREHDIPYSLSSPADDVGCNLTVGPDAAPRAVNPKTGKRKHVSAIVIFAKQFHQFPCWGFTG
jgi:hypothetical protein